MKRRSPIEEGPLRLPGDSIREQLVDLALGDLLPALIAAVLLSVMAFIEWQASINHWSRHPVLYAAVAVSAVAVCIWRFVRAGPRIRALELGRQGEVSVAEILDRLRASGSQVYHDIPFDTGNIDHVVLSTKGFYAIETKTRSKPTGRRSEISFQGEYIAVDGLRPDRDPLDQVQRNVRRLRALLLRKTKKEFEIKGVVLFPGWWVQRMDEAWLKANRPWVLNPSAFIKWIARSRESLALTDVHLAATHLEAYVRSLRSVSRTVPNQ